MRGSHERSGSLFSYVDIEARIPVSHLLPHIRELVNGALAKLDRKFETLYSPDGHPLSAHSPMGIEVHGFGGSHGTQLAALCPVNQPCRQKEEPAAIRHRLPCLHSARDPRGEQGFAPVRPDSTTRGKVLDGQSANFRDGLPALRVFRICSFSIRSTFIAATRFIANSLLPLSASCSRSNTPRTRTTGTTVAPLRPRPGRPPIGPPSRTQTPRPDG